MRKWLNWIGLGLMAAAAGAMIAADAFAAERIPQGQRFLLDFDMFSPADLSCDASGPGVRVRQSRDLIGKPVLRLSGNAQGAQITCWRPDGSRYTTAINRDRVYNGAGPVRATVTFRDGREAMTTVLQRGDGLLVDVRRNSFVRVKG